MTLQDLKEKDIAGLQEHLIALRKEQCELRLSKAVNGGVENPHRFRQIRRDIARVKTLLLQKDMKV